MSFSSMSSLMTVSRSLQDMSNVGLPSRPQSTRMARSPVSRPSSRNSHGSGHLRPTSFREQSLRSRGSSASSPLDSAQIQFYLNKRGSRTSITTSSSIGGETYSPTSTASSAFSTARDRHSSSGGRVITVAPITDAMDARQQRSSISSSGNSSGTGTGRGDIDSTGSLGGDETGRSRTTSPSSVARAKQLSPSLSSMAHLYVGELVWKIDDVVYVGGLDSVFNLNLLCRLNIDFVVDLSGTDPDENPRRRGDCPCMCARSSQHSRMVMAIRVPDVEDTVSMAKVNILELFDDFVCMVKRARSAGKAVLVYSARGRNRAPAFAAAYLMHHHHITRMQAIARVTKAMESKRPCVSIADHLQRALMRWQANLGVKASESQDAALSVPLFSIKRTAWT